MAGRRSVARWRDWREWQDVHAGLFASDAYDQQRAVSRVAAWRSRGEVPVSVNATAHLVEIALHERMADHQHHAIGVSARSHMELSLAYATAIVRCVNGLVDGSQKGTYAMAVSALAQRIGIPLWIVDLRHESTHNQLPSLPMLRFAANHLLAWLRSNYWYKQEEVIRAQVRQTGEALLAWLPPVGEVGGDAAPTPLKDALDTEKLRDNVVPLLVDGFQYGEQPFPTGGLFLPEYLPDATPAATMSETEAMSKYPKSELSSLVLELQSLWGGLSASLLAALGQKIVAAAQASENDSNANADATLELSFFWIKLLLSNEWRERMKYAEEPIEEIYRSGASVLAFSADRVARGGVVNTSLVEHLRVLLRACKGVRTHSVVGSDTAMRKQLDAPTLSQWTELSEWNPSPLGLLNGFVKQESETSMEYPLEIDQDASLVYTSPRIDVDVDDDDAIDRLMETLDAEYDASLSDMLETQRSVHEHVVQASHHGANQKVLPQQEVERIQNEIEIW